MATRIGTRRECAATAIGGQESVSAVHVIILVVPTPVVPCGAVPPSGPDGPTKQALFKQTEITNSLL